MTRTAIIALALTLVASGCGARQVRHTRTALAVAAEVVEEASNRAAPYYESRAEYCYETATTRAIYDECIGDVEAAAVAIIEAAQSIRVAEHMATAAKGDQVLGCVYQAITDMAEAFAVVGWELPAAVGGLLESVGERAIFRCDPERSE